MIIDFRQGIVDYDFTTFPFVVSGGGTRISLSIGTRPVTLTIAQASNNYTFTEPSNVNNAWTVPNSAKSWLYWDFNTQTLARTFGYTSLQPATQNFAPPSPQNGQMWYNTATFRNYVFTSGGWTEVLRVFAAEYNPLAAPQFQFISLGDQVPLPSGYPNFTGTQIGVNQVNVASGLPLFNYNGVPLAQGDGTFLTTESTMLAQGAPVTGVRLESNVYIASSSDVTTIPAYAVVAVQPSNGTFQLGSYNDAGNTAIAMAIQNIPAGGSGAVCLEGTITNTQWNWSNYIGELLWISGNQPGQLVTIDPHLSSPITYPVAQPPVARVLSQDTIIFLQGIGTKGPPGPPGGGGTVVPATPTVQGVVFLSTDGGTFTPPTNIVVAEGDPRLTNARIALASSVLAASNITVAPYTPSNTYGTTAQLALQALANNTLNLNGGTMTGNLILNADPTVPFQAATKNYVDTNFLSVETQVVLKTGSTMTGALILSGNPTVPLQAATKQYVDNVASGITFQAAVYAATTANLAAIYAGSPNYTLTATANGVFTVDGVTPPIGSRVLVKNQTTGTQNGVYDVTATGSVSAPFVLTRDAEQLPPNTIVSGTFVFVNNGSTQNNTGWILSTANPITLDSTSLTFIQFSSEANLTFASITAGLGYVPVGPFTVAGSTGISVSGSPVSGPSPAGLTLILNAELQGLSGLSTTGFVQRTGVGTYVAQALTASQVETALGYIPLASRNINTTAPLSGGGPLTGDLTLSILPFTGSGLGAVPVSPGGTTQFLRADGTWAVPPGGSGGGVSSVGLSTTSTGVTIGGTNPITTSGTITVNLNAELQGLAGLSTNGVVQRTGAGTYIAAPYTTALSGDVTAPAASGTLTTTLATVNSNVGSFTNASITVNAKGLITAASSGSGTATNLAGGAAGEIVYQSAPSTTGFSAAGTTGQLLISGGTGAPTWLTNSTPVDTDGAGTTPLVVGSTFNFFGTPNQVVTTASASTVTFSLPATINVNTSGNAASATNLAGGIASEIPYQTAAGATAFISNGTAGQVLTSNGTSAPTWQSISSSGEGNDVIFATSGQTVVTLTNVTATSKFPAGTTAFIQVFLNGVLQREDNSSGTAYATRGSFYVSSSSQITFFNALSLSDEVTVFQL